MRYNTRIQRKRPLKEKKAVNKGQGSYFGRRGFMKTDGSHNSSNCHLPTPPPIPAPLPAYLIHHGTSLCGPPPSPPPPGAMFEKKFCISSKEPPRQGFAGFLSFFYLRDDTLDSHAENQCFQIIAENTSAVKFNGHSISPQKGSEMFDHSRVICNGELWKPRKSQNNSFYSLKLDATSHQIFITLIFKRSMQKKRQLTQLRRDREPYIKKDQI